MIKKSLLILFLVIMTTSMVNGQEIFNFVPENSGYFLVLRSTYDYLNALKEKTNMFNAYLATREVDLESMLKNSFEALVRDSTGQESEEFVNDALKNDFLIAGEKFVLGVNDLISFDPVYLLESLKSSNSNIFLVWKSKEPELLLKAVSALLGMDPFVQAGSKVNELRSNSGVLYFYEGNEYIIVGTSERIVNKALDTYKGSNEGIVEKKEIGTKMADLSKNNWITGYFDSDCFKIELGADWPYTVDETFLVAGIEDDRFVSTISQNITYLSEEERNKFDSWNITTKNGVGSRVFGDYVAFFPSESVGTLRNELSYWFEMDLKPYQKLADLIVEISGKSEGKVTLCGNIISDTETPVLMMKFSGRPEDYVEERQSLKEKDAKEYLYGDYEVFEIEMMTDTFYFMFDSKNALITTIKPEKILYHLENGIILNEIGSYNRLRKKLDDKSIVEIFIDISKIYKTVAGLDSDTALLYQETINEAGQIIHTISFY
ncbi:MAG: hypothetical protein U9O65_05075 [Thermotogota bacterium]|nr:hypothetical protein [Thermotogota bacterium]